MKIRQELVAFCKENPDSAEVKSPALTGLREFAEKNAANVKQMSEYVQAKKLEMGDDSDDAESDGRSFVSYGESEDYNSDEESKNEEGLPDLMDLDDDDNDK